MLRPLLLAVALSTLLPGISFAATAPVAVSANAATTSLHRFFDEEWERGLREYPENATANGDTRFNDRWTDQSLDAIHKREAEDRDALARLKAIDRNALSEADRLNYDVYLWDLQRTVERQRFNEWQRPLTQRGGVQTADEIVELMEFRTVKDYEDWLKRLDALPTVLTQTEALMREGVKAGNTPSHVLMERVPAQIRAQLVDDVTKSRFYQPFLKFPDTVPEADRARLRARASELIRQRVIPAYREFATFFDTEYLPKTRTSIAAVDLPDGKAYYDFLAGYFTTTDLTADQIHEIGLKEVARIRGEMEKVKAEVGFKGTMQEFFQYLRTDPRFFKKTPDELFEAYQAVAKRIDPELVKVFRTIPRLPYGVRPIPAASAPDTTTAYYQPGASDGSRAGYYYVNLYKPETRPTWEMVPLSLHEAVPGHHFQFARGLEMQEAPMFRRTAYFVAYGEGWGLYAERLGYDMGLYDDPYDRMGQLAYDMWRAVRLVVDTGMHAKGWSRDRAIEYFMDNSPKTRQDVVNEIDRYISWPGQALGYKIGQMKISELRERSARELGDRFDLRDYDDAVLETGSVPLSVLEKHIDEWIAARKQAPAAAKAR
ncbi:DUF885 domain-containing protein [Lysobacter sp. TY2-98]|uniref:DUF885 domain-containing protein n=1 Tax=Lysobacter sp. TY2-98 TaxID=2290922 RepID=UPI000E2058D3|nr:DUF885 domain-containing protein [Lysobacter sp. TY2-98]AXK71843.1 DUF885 domain-containing protein [Lysobacter sp. TY2-98]